MVEFKKKVVILLSIFLILTSGCGKSGLEGCRNIGEIDGEEICLDGLALSEEEKLGLEEEIVREAIEDISLCESLEEEARGFCRDNHYLSKALEKEEFGLCENIQDRTLKEECLKLR